MTFEGHLIEGDIVTRTDLDYSTGEEYLFEKRGGYIRYGTKWKENVYVGAMLKVEDVSTEVKADSFPEHFDEDRFFISDFWIPEGTLVTLNLSVGKGKYNSTTGYPITCDCPAGRRLKVNG